MNVFFKFTNKILLAKKLKSEFIFFYFVFKVISQNSFFYILENYNNNLIKTHLDRDEISSGNYVILKIELIN